MRISKLSMFAVSFAVIGLLAAGPGAMRASAQATAESIAERAAELRAFRDLLRSEDSLERIAAFEAGMASDDPVVRKITLEEAFKADDKDLQSLALKMWLKTRSSLLAEVELPDRPTDAQKKLYADVAPSLQLNKIALQDNGEVVGYLGPAPFTGQFVPGGMILKRSRCELRLAVANSDTLSGSYGCGPEGHLPLVVKIN